MSNSPLRASTIGRAIAVAGISSAVILGSFAAFAALANTSSALTPLSLGNYGDWSVNTGTKVAAVASNDSDTTYISESTNGKGQTFLFANAGIPADAAVNSVTITAVAKQDGSHGSKIKLREENGTTAGHHWEGVTGSGSVGSSYSNVSWTMTTDQSTGVAWTTDEVNAWTKNFGVVLDDNDAARVTQLYLTVDYTASQAALVIDSINGQDPGGHCIAGALSIVVHGTRGANGGPYFVEAGNGTSTSTPVSVGSGANGSFSNITINFTPTGTGTNLYVILYHGSDTGNDSHSVLVNQCIPPATQGVVTVIKHVSGGSAVASNFSLHVEQSSVDVSGSPAAGSETGTDYKLNPGTYTVSETANANYTPSFSGACDSSGNVTVVAGKNYTCTLTNTYAPPTTGVLHVVKHVVTDNGGSAVAGDFSVHVKSGASEVSGSPQAGSETGTDYTLAGATYTVSEDGGPSGYAESFSGGCNSSGTVVVTNGTTTTCTITNNDIAPTITIQKTVSLTHGGTATVSSFQYFIDTVNEILNNVATATTVGAHTVSESTLTGYTAGDWGGDCAANGTLTLTLGQNATCTITNSDQPGTLVVKKVLVGAPQGVTPDQFSFQVNGGTATAFNANGENDLTEDAGTYHVAEVSNPAYSSGYANCDPVTVTNGGTSTCTITNTFKTGNIVVVKNTVGPDGANTSFSFTTNYGSNGFSLNGGGSNNDSGNLDPGTYSVTENATAGWDQTSASCDHGNSDPTNITLTADETVTCTFTNTERGHIIVKKVTDPTSSEQSFTFTPTGYGDGTFNLSNGGQNDSGALVPGSYGVSEALPSGWVQTSATCDNDNSPSAITLTAGQTVTCTFTNTEPPTLTIVKHTVGGDGSFTFSVTQGETEIASTTLQTSNGSATSSVIPLSAGTYNLTENVPTGWTLGNEGHPTCVYDGGGVGSPIIANGEQLVLADGQDVTCTFTDTNNNPATDISVTKSVDLQSADTGDKVTYTLTATNNGPADATGVSVTDTLPSGLTYVSDDGAGAYVSSTGIWTIGTLANASTTTLHIVASVNDGTQGNKITNTAAISSINPDTNTGNDSGSATVTVNTPPVPPPSGGGGAGGPLILGGGGQVLGASIGPGQVLGVSCGLYMNQHLRQGSPKNSQDQVMKLQQFLNKYGFGTFTPTGNFGSLTLAAVNAFQTKYADEILKPWNLSGPTGLVYLTTLRQVNLIECPDLTLQLPELVPWSKNPSAQ